MKKDNKKMLIEKSKSDIENLTKNLNDELAKIHLFSANDEFTFIFGECANITGNINKKIASFNKLMTNKND